MDTQTNTEIEEQFALELDSLDTSLDKVRFHLIMPQQGAFTHEELLALPELTALCGYVTRSKRPGPPTGPLICPKCLLIYHTIG
jgi:hypothetical protein